MSNNGNQNGQLSPYEERRIEAFKFSKRFWKNREKAEKPVITALHVIIPLWVLFIASLITFEFAGYVGLTWTLIILSSVVILLQPVVRDRLRSVITNNTMATEKYKKVDPWKDCSLYLNKTEQVAFFHDGYDTIKGITLFRLIPAKNISQNLYGFYRACYHQGIPVFWGHYVIPKGASDVKENMNENLRYQLENTSSGQMEMDLEKVGGVWEMTIIIGTQVSREIKTSMEKTIERVESEILRLRALLDGKLAAAFPHAKVLPLRSDELIKTIHSLSLGGSLPSFFISLGEALTHRLLHVPSFAKEKSMKSHIPAEFNVPTYLKADVPIGYIIEQELMKLERVGGFELKNLFSNILITGGNPNERFHLISRILNKTCEFDFCTIMLTTSHKYRNLLDFIPNLRIIRLGTDSALKIFHSELSCDEDYMTLLTETMAAIFNLSASGTEHLERMLLGFQETKSDSLKDFIGYVALEMDSVERQLSYSDRESFRTIQNLFGNLVIGKGADFFGGWQIPMHKLLKQPIIIEISLESETKKRFALYLLLVKILSSIEGLNYRGGLIFVEDSRLLMDPSVYKNNKLHNYFSQIIEKLNKNGFGIVCDLTRPSLFDETVLGMFKNFISFRVGPEQVKHLSKFLNIKTLQESKFTKKRHSPHHYDYLINMEPNTCLLKLPEQSESFPLFIPQVKNLREVNTWTDDDVDLFLSDDTDVMEFHERSDTPMIATTMLKKVFSSKKELDHAYLILVKTYQNQDLNIDSISIADQIYYDLLDTGEIEEHERSDRSRLIKLLVIKLANYHFLKGEQIPAGNHTVMKYTITQKGINALEEHEKILKSELEV